MGKALTDRHPRAVMAGLWLLVVAVLLGVLLVQVWRAAVTAGWPRVTATMVRAELVPPDGLARLEYEYEINGQRYKGREISRFGLWSGIAQQDELVKRFAAGSRPEVAVNPADPREAYLQAGWRTVHLAPLLLLVPAVCLLGVVLAGSLSEQPGARLIGPFVAFEKPLPRLVLVERSAAELGLLIGAGVSGAWWVAAAAMTRLAPLWSGQTSIPPGIDPGPGELHWMLLVAPAAGLFAAAGAYLWRKRQLALAEMEIIIDPKRRLLVGPKRVGREREIAMLDQIYRLRLREVYTSDERWVEMGERTVRVPPEAKYELWVRQTGRDDVLLYTSKSKEQCEAALDWIRGTLLAAGYGNIDVHAP